MVPFGTGYYRKMNSYRRWTPEEVAFLRQNCKMPIDELSEALGRTKNAIWEKAAKLGLYQKKWTQADVMYCGQNFAITITGSICL